MLETRRHGPMDPALLKPPSDLLEESSGSGGTFFTYTNAKSLEVLLTRKPVAEGRPRKRIQRTASENEDPLRRGPPQTTVYRGTTMGPPLALGAVDSKGATTKRRSTLRESSKPMLLGPRPMDTTGKRFVDMMILRSEQSDN
jgi:hypothetical protein